MRQPTGDNTLAGYVRQSSADIIPTATLRAAPINAEYNKLRDAFATSSGHKHDGSTGEGGYIPLIGDVDALNKVVINTNNNTVGVFVEVSSAAVEQVRFQDGVILPVTTNDIDLGAVGSEFKDLYVDGTGYIDTLAVHENATVSGTLAVTGVVTASAGVVGNLTGNVTGNTTGNVTGNLTGDVASSGTSTFSDLDTVDLLATGTTVITSIDLNSGAIDNTTIGNSTPVAGTFTTLNANTSLVAATADINGGTIDGAALGATTPSTGSFTTLGASGTSTLATVDINGGNIDGTVIGASVTAAGSFTTLSTSGQATLATADINGGSIDGSTIGASSASTGAFTTLTSSGGITGNVTGNLTGNVTGNVTGDVTGNVTGNLTGNVTAGSGTSTFTNVTIDGTLNMNAGTSATIQNLTAPTNDLDAATKKYVDDEISGLIGDAGAGLDTLGELADALNDDDDFSTTVTNSIATKLPKAGGTMTGAIAMSNNKITGAGDPTSAQDVATKAYTDAQRDTRVAKTGDTMSGALAMGNNKITGLGTPTATTDATSKTYVDGLFQSTTDAATSATNAATSATNAATSATNSSNSASAASTSAANAASSYDNFDDRYLGSKSSAPTVDNDGDAIITGALYFNSTSNIMYVYGGSGWQAAGSSVNGTSERNTYTATAGQTVFAVTYDAGFIDVYLNGVKLLVGTDFTATNGTSITLASGASVNDVVDIVAYGTFVLADHYTKTASDARYVQPTHTGNLDITGTVISDGLTVNSGAVGLIGTFIGSADSRSLTLSNYDAGFAGSGYALNAISSGGEIKLQTTSTDRLKIASNGDISFYEDTGTTATFFWDASTERLGLGTTSPSRLLTVSPSTGSAQIGLISQDSSQSEVLFGDAADDNVGRVYYDHASNSMSLWTNAAERMRIDSSGNVLVGKTSTNIATDGVELGVRVEATADGSYPLRLNRRNSDGDIINFRKDGSTVGSIGTRYGSMYIHSPDGTNGSGLRFVDGYVQPCESNGSDSSGDTDLGQTNSRFKDLYLSGSAFIDTQTRLANGSATTPSYSFSSDSDSGMFRATTNTLGFATAGAERMRIDSSGDLLVGTTDGNPTGNHVPGTLIFAGGQINVHRDGGNPLRVGTSIDGNLTEYYRQGALVGSIGVVSSNNLRIGGSVADHAGFEFGTNRVTPQIASSVSDGVVDLGYETQRFKDLYLSGGVYLGGTGAANKLEDYEEGTFTPALNASTGTFTLSIAQGAYVKVGGLVHVILRIRINSISDASGSVKLAGLPFPVAAKMGSTSYESWANVQWDGISTSAVSIPFVGVDSSSTCDVFINTAATTNNIQSPLQVSDVAANASFRVYMTYQT